MQPLNLFPIRIARTSFALGGALVFLSGAAQAITVLDPCAHNGVILSADITIGYHDPVAAFAPVPIPPPAPGANLVRTVPAPTTIVVAPTPGGTATTGLIVRTPAVTTAPAGKDRVEGQVLSRFDYGAPTGAAALDTFRLRAHGIASAVGSFDTAGNAADAVVEGKAIAEFYINAVAGTGCTGQILLPPLRPRGPYESVLQVQVLSQPLGAPGFAPIFTQPSPSPAALVPIGPTAAYRVELLYSLRVPHGIDPPFDAEVAFSLMSDEEIAAGVPALDAERQALLALALALAGGCAILVHRRKRVA